MRYLTSQIFTPRETPVEPSSGKASHFSWALLGTGGIQFLNGEKKCLLLFCLKKNKYFSFLSFRSVYWSRFGRTARVARVDFFLLWTLPGCFALGPFRWNFNPQHFNTGSGSSYLLFPVKPAWGVGGEGEPVQHAQPDH